MKLSRKVRNNIYGYLFILPNLVGFVVFTFFSVLFSLYLSFTEWSLTDGLDNIKLSGFGNFIEIFKDKWFIDSILNNFYFVLFIPLYLFLGLVIAVLINDRVYLSGLIKTSIYLPQVTNYVAISLMWFMLLHPSKGVVNKCLVSLGVTHPPAWFGSSLWVKPSIVLMMAWGTMGYYMIMYLSGLKGIPEQLYEAARVDGANKITQFIKITIPMLSPTTFFLLITGIISSFNMWSNIQILTDGGPGTSSTVIGFYIYKCAFQYSKMGYAASISWVLFAVVLVVTLIQWKAQKDWVNYM